MSQYYFLGTLLPELNIDQKPDIQLRDLDNLLTQNLSSEDLKKLYVLKLYFDIENIRYFWMNQKISKIGKFDDKALEQALLARVGFPQYVYDFMDRYNTNDKRLSHFSSLLYSFFQHEIVKASGFLQDLLKFEREIRLVLAAFRAKKYKRDLFFEMQFENPDDPLVAQIIAQKDAPTYEPPEAFHELKSIFEKYGDEPLALQKAIIAYRFNRIQNLIGLQAFTSDRILAYFFQLVLLEKWFRLDEEKGKKIIDYALRGQNG